MSGYANPSMNSNVSLFRLAPAYGQHSQWWLKPVTIMVSLLLLTGMLSPMFSGLAGITGANSGSILSDPSGSSGVPDTLKALLTVGAVTFIGGCIDKAADVQEDINEKTAEKVGAQDSDPYGLDIYDKITYIQVEQQQAQLLGEKPDGVIDLDKQIFPIDITIYDGTTKHIATEEEFMKLEYKDFMRPMGAGKYDLSLVKLMLDMMGDGYKTTNLCSTCPDNDFMIDANGDADLEFIFTGDGRFWPVFNKKAIDKNDGFGDYMFSVWGIESGNAERMTPDNLDECRYREFEKDVNGDVPYRELIPKSGLYTDKGLLRFSDPDSAGVFIKDSKGNIKHFVGMQVKD